MAIIDKPNLHFETKLYTGTGSSLAISGLNFAPDLVWIKIRSSADSHALYDSVRGVQEILQSDRTNAEITQTNGLSAFDSDGFTIGDNGQINTNTSTYASWNWKAGTSFTNDASATGIGTIDSTGSVNTTSGFSIVSYTGTGADATVGHGLSSAPAMIIIKAREDVNSEAQHWIVYHQSLGNTSYIWLNRNIAKGTSALGWNDTSPTSNVFSLGNGWTPNNYSGSNYIAYCFAEKQGYSKFGSYTGNGNADGTFVYTGFKPAFILIKQTNAVGAWYMWDNKRDTINPYQKYLIPNGTNVEYSGAERWLDSLSNGFKWRNTETAMNDSGATYIYMAIAENPFVTSTGVPATAR
jgi:hypothetical protein